MARVKCPHCGAGNQDAAEQDVCWQCGNVLGAPVARGQTTPRPAAVAEASAPTQQLDPSQIQFAAQPTGQYQRQGVSQRTLAILAVIAVLAVGGAVIGFVMLVMK